MKYTTVIDENGRKLVTSVLAGGDDEEKRMRDGKFVLSNDVRLPLVRTYSSDKTTGNKDGAYFIYYRDEGKWKRLGNYSFKRASQAEKHFASLHMFFEELMVVQFYKDNIYTGLDRFDPNDYGNEEQGEDEEITGEDDN